MECEGICNFGGNSWPSLTHLSFLLPKSHPYFHSFLPIDQQGTLFSVWKGLFNTELWWKKISDSERFFFFFFLIISYVQIQILGWLNFYILIFRIFSYTYTLSKQGVLTGSVSWKVQCWPLMWSAGLLRIRAQHCVSLGERRLQRRPQLSSLSYGPWETDLTLLKFPCWQVWWTWHWGY